MIRIAPTLPPMEELKEACEVFIAVSYTHLKAAIAGGTTSILDFTTQEKGQTLTEALDV